MILENEQQRQFLLALIDQANFPGTAVEFVAAMKEAIRSAAVADKVQVS